MAAIMEQLCWCATWCEMMWMDRGSEWINWEATWRCKTILKHPLAGNTAFLQSVQCWNVLNVSLALSMSREALTKPSIQVFAEQETVDGFDPPGSFNRQAVHATDRFDAKKRASTVISMIIDYCILLLDVARCFWCFGCFRKVLDVIEIMATLLFTVEYGLRYFSAPEAPTMIGPGILS